jgi:hypothetical protein
MLVALGRQALCNPRINVRLIAQSGRRAVGGVERGVALQLQFGQPGGRGFGQRDGDASQTAAPPSLALALDRRRCRRSGLGCG